MIISKPLSVSDVRRQITFCKKIGLEISGIVENMSLFACPCCGDKFEIFPSKQKVSELAQECGINYYGSFEIAKPKESEDSEKRPKCAFGFILDRQSDLDVFSKIC